jgi:hypothetical protein
MTSPQQHINARAIRARRLALLADIAIIGLMVVAGITILAVATELLIAALAP